MHFAKKLTLRTRSTRWITITKIVARISARMFVDWDWVHVVVYWLSKCLAIIVSLSVASQSRPLVATAGVFDHLFNCLHSNININQAPREPRFAWTRTRSWFELVTSLSILLGLWRQINHDARLFESRLLQTAAVYYRQLPLVPGTFTVFSGSSP